MDKQKKENLIVIEHEDHVDLILNDDEITENENSLDNSPEIPFDQIFIPDFKDKEKDGMVADDLDELDQDRFVHRLQHLKTDVLLGLTGCKIVDGSKSDGPFIDPRYNKIRMRSGILMILPNA